MAMTVLCTVTIGEVNLLKQIQRVYCRLDELLTYFPCKCKNRLTAYIPHSPTTYLLCGVDVDLSLNESPYCINISRLSCLEKCCFALYCCRTKQKGIRSA